MLPWWNGRHKALKMLRQCVPVRVRLGVPKFGENMSQKTSLDYTELAGLQIALSNLSKQIDPIVKSWLETRIEQLKNK